MLYEKLPSPTSTRLIKLLPGAPDEPLECELMVIDLESDHVQYQAVSYVWGKPSDKKAIQCMSEALMIPSSLHAFLKTARDTGKKTRICWADAICINQSDHPERAHQVGMMGTIFSKAKRVLVYLGEQPTGFKEFISASSALLKLLPDKIDSQRPNLDILKVTADKVISWSILDTFEELVSRPWYQRVWTLQEFVLAQDLVMCIGTWATRYHTWRAVCYIFDELYADLHYRRSEERGTSKVPPELLRCKHARSFLDQCRDSYVQEASIRLIDFIKVSLQLDTTNLCDHLYGGYGILERAVMQSIPVDYGISPGTLSRRLSGLLLSDGNLSFVLQHSSGLNDDVPTWCINLDRSHISQKVFMPAP